MDILPIFDCAVCGIRMVQDTITPFHAPEIGHTMWNCPEKHTSILLIINPGETLKYLDTVPK